jgi:hypothetical protein
MVLVLEKECWESIDPRTKYWSLWLFEKATFSNRFRPIEYDNLDKYREAEYEKAGPLPKKPPQVPPLGVNHEIEIPLDCLDSCYRTARRG